ncbi:MAG: hypothetical protein KME64_42815 [Scytonematopsis contorta HA4267-MV1]|nr:hypothetical protein [Scytonematopsis contorta HA4267-MV1]
MFKRFGELFEKLNVALGAVSLAAIGIGALTTFGGLGLRHLTKGGVEIIPEKRAEQIANLGISAITFGLLGYSSGVALAYGAAMLPQEVSASITAVSQTLKRKKSQVQDDKSRIKYTYQFQSDKIDIYLYKVMTIKGLEDKLVVGRVEDKSSHKIVIYNELQDYQIDSLCKIFDVDYDQDKLVGKGFSSLKPIPDSAIVEYISAHKTYIYAVENSFYNCSVCKGCTNLYGDNDIVCGIHPYGLDDFQFCPDKKLDSRLVYHCYEREEIIDNFNQQIKLSKAYIQKTDEGYHILWDEHFNRKFYFEWSGNLMQDSDQLNQLGSTNLVDYVQFFSSREIIEQDFSGDLDKINEELKGIAIAQISDKGINLFVKSPSLNSGYTRVYRFRFDGVPLYPYESIVPKKIRNDYNLLNFVEFLKSI